jgi:hypothetical protein
MEARKYLCVTLPTFYIAALIQLNQAVQAHQMVRTGTTRLEIYKTVKRSHINFSIY